MGGNTHFKAQHRDTDSAEYVPVIKLPQDLARNADTALGMRETMSPELQTMLKLTDMMALRSAALPQSD